MLFFVPNVASLPGGTTRLTPADLKNPDVVVDAKFSVDEYNREKNLTLEFQNLIGGSKKVVSGVQYHLVVNTTINTSGECVVGKYEAVVWVHAGTGSKQLVSFTKIF
ncbi:Cysteine proteinase inhibitor 1 [Striga hermonthica]|uniref:Cysteine proteinase inhibitor 1 n=1 Tax=Striga hermonthica TaxID=68872 RepID=A0A9N7RQF3_STRHE|nr:Cysteine proteinase inhibitor 1 [Striga hermonthica]